MPNFGYHFARAQAHAIRRIYRAALSAIARRPIKVSAELPFEVYAYSGERDLPEQVASIRSFLRNAGRPQKFTVVSDGTHSPRGRALLQSIDSSVAVVRPVQPMKTTPENLRAYLEQHSTGKQLALIMSLPEDAPAFYFDSDVLFFPGAEALRAFDLTRNRYLADCQLSVDERLLRTAAERNHLVNTGVLFLAHKLDWSLSLERFVESAQPPIFFTNQTMTHLTMHLHKTESFDPRKFVLQLDDQFVYPDRYASGEIVLRHYVNPVRHKFWTALWRS